jgi:hypothetical protein
MSFTLFLDSNNITTTDTEELTVSFNKPIDLGEGAWECALIKANLWYAWHNISSTTNSNLHFPNNTFRYYNGAIWQTVTVPNGQYAVSDLNDYLHYEMRANGDYTLSGTTYIYDIEILADQPTGKVEFVFTGGYQLDLTTSDIWYILGGTSSIYTTSGDLENEANMINDINSVIIHNSIIQGQSSYLNSFASDIQYSFVPSSAPGSNIEIQPINRVYSTITVADNLINSIKLTITDNLNRSIDLQNQPVTYYLELRKIR